MSSLNQIDEPAIRDAVRRAVLLVYNRDWELLRDRTNERSVLFHIGRYLAADAETWPGSWSVDLEYNRWHQRALNVVREKYLEDFPIGKRRRVYPDLIVYDRLTQAPYATSLYWRQSTILAQMIANSII
jgi:hypothetical protein